MRTVDRDIDGWIARRPDGSEYPEQGFRWRTRAGAWHAAKEAKMKLEPFRGEPCPESELLPLPKQVRA